jgi:hypothetical protein
VRAVIRIKLPVSSPPAALFAPLPAARRIHALALSIAIHAVFVAIIPAIGDFIRSSFYEDYGQMSSISIVPPFKVVIPDRIPVKTPAAQHSPEFFRAPALLKKHRVVLQARIKPLLADLPLPPVIAWTPEPGDQRGLPIVPGQKPAISFGRQSLAVPDEFAGRPAQLIVVSPDPAVKEILTVPQGTTALSQVPAANGFVSPNAGNENSTVFITPPAISGFVRQNPAVASPQPESPVEIIRKEHPPAGSYDVVVVQSGSSPALPRDAGVLKSKPVYTVYLDVGLPKTCTLQFCVTPTEAPPVPASPIINLLETTAIEAPYPSLTLVPRPVQSWRDPIFIHGFLTSAGRFRNLSFLGTPGSEEAYLLILLQDWEFRPARLGAERIEVEFVLTIPPLRL